MRRRAYGWVESLEGRTLLSNALHGGEGDPGHTPEPPRSERLFTVMTQNLYQGAELTPVFAAGNAAELAQAVSQVWADVQATNFPARARALADEIAAAAGPALIGLQEATRWSVQPPGGGGAAAAQTLDFVQILRNALAARGLRYDVAAEADHVSARLPDAQGRLIGFTDRDVILARRDVPASVLKVSNARPADFQASYSVPVAGTGLAVEVVRGWASVDAKVRGKTVRVVTTHLEPVAPQVPEVLQLGQAAELLAGPAATRLPVVLVGDFNSDAYYGAFGGPDATGTYGLLTAPAGGGFTDAWAAAHPAEVGFTWGQAPGLDNLVSTLNERIDHVFVRGGGDGGGLGVRSAEIVGSEPLDRALPPFWASDHAGLVATLRVAGAGATTTPAGLKLVASNPPLVPIGLRGARKDVSLASKLPQW